MNMNKIDFNLLKVFVTVYQEKSLKKAGEKLFVTTPAVSQNIKKLRELLDEELFILSHRKFMPTPYSDELYAKIFPMLEGISLAIEDTKMFNPQTLQQSFKLDMNPHILDWLTPEIYKPFHQQSPKSSLVLHNISPSTLHSLCDGSIDAAIHFESENLPSEIVTIPLTKLQFIIAIRRGHPFKKSVAKIDELLEYPFAHIDLAYLDNSKHSRLEDRLRGENKHVHMSMRTTSVTSLIQTVMHTNTAAPCFPPTIKAYQKELRQVKILGMEDIESINLCLYLHQKNIHSPKYKWLVSLVSEVVKANT